MTFMQSAAIILKSDGVGRVRTPVERQVAMVREFERSGLSGARFAALAGVKYQTFASWRRRHGRGTSDRPYKPRLKFVEAVVAASPPPRSTADSGLMVRLPGGASLSIHQGSQVRLAAQLLKALAATSC